MATKVSRNLADTDVGTVLQVVSYTSTGDGDISNTSNTVYVDTDLVVSISPKSASSKLIIEATGSFQASATSQGVKIRLLRDGVNQTTGGTEDLLGLVYNGETANNIHHNPCLMAEVDSVSTDSSEFKITFASYTNGGTASYNRNWANGYIKIMEVVK